MTKQWQRRALIISAGLVLIALGGCALFQTGVKAVIALDVTEGTVPLTVAFDGTASTSPDGISTYLWSFGTGDESYDASGSYTFQHAGTFVVQLTVRANNGKTVSAQIEVTVQPAIWITDENLDRVYKLDMSGAVLTSFDLPLKEPYGIALAEIAGQPTLVIACANEGFQRLLYLDPSTGGVRDQFSAPGQSPRQVTYGATGQKQIWHVDALSRKLYRLNPSNAQIYESYGEAYFKATSPQVALVPFLWTPEGLDWTPETNAPGNLWYLEGETHLFYKIRMIAGYDIMSNTQLQIDGDPVEITGEIFPVAAIDMYGGYLWAIDVDHHRIVKLDPETGQIAGTPISGFPGSAPAGLEIQF
jgi:PKD repeat protein